MEFSVGRSSGPFGTRAPIQWRAWEVLTDLLVSLHAYIIILSKFEIGWQCRAPCLGEADVFREAIFKVGLLEAKSVTSCPTLRETLVGAKSVTCLQGRPTALPAQTTKPHRPQS